MHHVSYYVLRYYVLSQLSSGPGHMVGGWPRKKGWRVSLNSRLTLIQPFNINIYDKKVNINRVNN